MERLAGLTSRLYHLLEALSDDYGHTAAIEHFQLVHMMKGIIVVCTIMPVED